MAGGERCQQNNHCNAKLASTHVGVEKHVCVPNVEVGMETNGEGKRKRKQPRHFLFSHRRSRISRFSDPKMDSVEGRVSPKGTHAQHAAHF